MYLAEVSGRPEHNTFVQKASSPCFISFTSSDTCSCNSKFSYCSVVLKMAAPQLSGRTELTKQHWGSERHVIKNKLKCQKTKCYPKQNCLMSCLHQGFAKHFVDMHGVVVTLLLYRISTLMCIKVCSCIYREKRLHHRFKICKNNKHNTPVIESPVKKRLTSKPFLRKRNRAKCFKFYITDMPAFHRCMTGKMSFYWWILQKVYVRRLAGEGNHSAAVFQCEREYSGLVFKFSFFTPILNCKAFHQLFTTLSGSYLCGEVSILQQDNELKHTSKHWGGKNAIAREDQEVLTITRIPLLYNQFHFNLAEHLKTEKAKHFSHKALWETDQRCFGLSGFGMWTWGVYASSSSCSH